MGKKQNKGHKPEKVLGMGFYSFRSGLLLFTFDRHLLRDERPKETRIMLDTVSLICLMSG